VQTDTLIKGKYKLIYVLNYSYAITFEMLQKTNKKNARWKSALKASFNVIH